MGYAELVSFSVITAIDNEEEDIIASVLSDINNFFAVTWDRVKAESLVDPELQDLYSLLKYGFIKTRREIPRGLESYWKHRGKLMVWDGAILFTDCFVVPKRLRAKILENICSVHQGTCGMLSRASTVVISPNRMPKLPQECTFFC